MTDIIRDIDEEMRRDAFLSRVRRYSPLFLIVMVIVLVVVAGGYFWQDRQSRIKASNAEQLNAALAQADSDPAAAREALLSIAETGADGNAIIAGFETAALDLKNGDASAAADALEKLATVRGDDPYGRAATLFSAYAEINSAPLADIKAKLQPLIDENGPFAELAMELLALASVQAGEGDAAKALLDDLLGREGLDRELQQRAETLRAGL